MTRRYQRMPGGVVGEVETLAATKRDVSSVVLEWDRGSIAFFMTVSCSKCKRAEGFNVTGVESGTTRLKERGWRKTFDGSPICEECIDRLLADVAKAREKREQAERFARLMERRNSGDFRPMGLFV